MNDIVSPYLLKPIRSEAQARADIERNRMLRFMAGNLPCPVPVRVHTMRIPFHDCDGGGNA